MWYVQIRQCVRSNYAGNATQWTHEKAENEEKRVIKIKYDGLLLATTVQMIQR